MIRIRMQCLIHHEMLGSLAVSASQEHSIDFPLNERFQMFVPNDLRHEVYLPQEPFLYTEDLSNH